MSNINNEHDGITGLLVYRGEISTVTLASFEDFQRVLGCRYPGFALSGNPRFREGPDEVSCMYDKRKNKKKMLKNASPASMNLLASMVMGGPICGPVLFLGGKGDNGMPTPPPDVLEQKLRKIIEDAPAIAHLHLWGDDYRTGGIQGGIRQDNDQDE